MSKKTEGMIVALGIVALAVLVITVTSMLTSVRQTAESVTETIELVQDLEIDSLEINTDKIREQLTVLGSSLGAALAVVKDSIIS